MDDAADHAPVIHPRLAPHIARQMRLDPLPLTLTQPKQVLAHFQASESRASESASDSNTKKFIGFRP
jgi:hypothetical protein